MFTVFSYQISEKHILIAILFLGAILRFWGLGSAEFYHDEGFLAFRSIGYLDYIQNDAQTTPVQWFRDTALPWWTNLSFHDHPPLFFLIQNIFFKIFGVSLFIARLPSAIAGILSIYLVFLISKIIFSGKNKLIVFFAPLLFSVSSIHIWISRSSLQESVQIFFILLNIYYFFRFIDNRSKTTNDNPNLQINWVLFGGTLGLAFLTKYTSFFLAPVYLFYFAYQSYLSYQSNKSYNPDKFDQSYKSNKSYKTHWIYLFFAFGLALLIFSPVLVYNFYLWKTVGHFDLQFSYLFNQNTPEWQASLGKIQDPFSDIVKNLVSMYSLPFLIATILGIIYEIYRLIFISRAFPPDLRVDSFTPLDKRVLSNGASPRQSASILWLLNIVFITLMLTAVGSAFRFIALYAVPAIMIVTFIFDYLFSRFNQKILLKILTAGFVIYELFFSLDIFLNFPDFGIVALDGYFDSEFGNARSLSMPVSSNPHLNNVIKSYASLVPVGDKPIFIIYDENISLSPRLWLFTRRNYYNGIPAVTVDQFKRFLNERGIEEFSGYELYFIKASDQTYINPLYSNPSAQEFEDFLKNNLTLTPAKLIYGYNNFLMFTVFKFSL